LPPQDGRFRQPTDVAWDSEGNIYITDGYVNSRVAKYDKNGDWVKSWASRAPVRDSSARRTRSRSTRTRTCTSAIAATSASGVRYRRQVSADVQNRDPAAPGTKAVNGPRRRRQHGRRRRSKCRLHHAGPNQVMFVGESTWPGRIFKVTLDGKVLGVIGKSGRS